MTFLQMVEKLPVLLAGLVLYLFALTADHISAWKVSQDSQLSNAMAGDIDFESIIELHSCKARDFDDTISWLNNHRLLPYVKGFHHVSDVICSKYSHWVFCLQALLCVSHKEAWDRRRRAMTKLWWGCGLMRSWQRL